MTSFEDFTLPPALHSALKAMNFSAPTPIQSQAIPPILEGRDVLATAMTGSGKTAAFSIPMVSKLLASSRGTALVMLPTRELANQVETVVKQLLNGNATIRSALLIGGDSMPMQQQALRARPRIIVGTPGRLIDHLQRGSLMLHDANYIVLDEADRMLDMGFEDQILQILRYLPAQRQTLLFSATLPPAIQALAGRYLRQPVRIEVGEANKAADRIDQQSVEVTSEQKYSRLLSELEARSGSVIIFVRAKHATEKLAAKLRKSGHLADAIHGDLEQRARERVLADFRAKQHRILVATDIASRGLDIPHIEHVVNYDLPQAPEDYIHRIGRTARAGAAGAAISFISPEDGLKWRAIQSLMNPGAPLPPVSRPSPAKSGAGDEKSGGSGRSRRRGGGGARKQGAPAAPPANPGVAGQGAANQGTGHAAPARRRHGEPEPDVTPLPASMLRAL